MKPVAATKRILQGVGAVVLIELVAAGLFIEAWRLIWISAAMTTVIACFAAYAVFTIYMMSRDDL